MLCHFQLFATCFLHEVLSPPCLKHSRQEKLNLEIMAISYVKFFQILNSGMPKPTDKHSKVLLQKTVSTMAGQVITCTSFLNRSCAQAHRSNSELCLHQPKQSNIFVISIFPMKLCTEKVQIKLICMKQYRLNIASER